jgi:hypothetical protein
LKNRFGSPIYRNAENVVVKYTDVKTGKTEEIPLSEFRERMPEPPISKTDPTKHDTEVIGIAPDDTLKPGAKSIKLGIDEKPLLDKIIENIDGGLGGK